MTTIRVNPTHPATQGPFVIIDKSDFNPALHQLFGADATALPLAVVPSADQAGEADRLAQLAAELAARDAALLAREQALAAAHSQAGEVPPPDTPADVTSLSKEQLHAALDAKGIKYPANANKTELQALLAAG